MYNKVLEVARIVVIVILKESESCKNRRMCVVDEKRQL